MTNFTYEGVNFEGKSVQGVIKAQDKNAAMELLIERNIYPKDIKKLAQKKSFYEKHIKKVSFKDIVIFSREFAFIVNAGFPLLEWLGVVRNQVKNSKFKEILDEIYLGIEKGGALSDEISKHKEFPEMYASMIKSAETSGNLSNTLNVLADYYDKQYKIKKKIASAMTYPILVFGLALVMIIFIITFIMPKMVANITDGGGTLPGITRVFISISNVLINYGILIVIMTAAIIYLVCQRVKDNRQILIKFHRFKTKIPIFGRLINMLIAARFSRTLGTLLISGIGIIESLDLSARVVQNEYVISKMEFVKARVGEGESIGESIKTIDIFPQMLVESIVVGERGGNLDEVLTKTSVFYENDIDVMTNQLSSILQPIIIVFLGIMIAFIAIAMYMPLFTMYDSI